MVTSTKNNLIKYLETHNYATAKELAEYLNITPQALFRHIKQLLQQKQIIKIGTSPKVYYQLSKETLLDEEDTANLDKHVKKIINDNFLVVTPIGELKEGIEGFKYWANKTKQNFAKTAVEYVETLKKYDKFKRGGLIDGTEKIAGTFEKNHLNKVFYLDFYAIERFGKTQLGSLILYAKQSQNIELIDKISELTRDSINKIIEKYKIDGVGFIPPTVPRGVQFMTEFKKDLKLRAEAIDISKPNQYIPVAQKTLSKLSDRIENARESIFVDSRKVFNNILLIDDAVGSGSTLNETAKKIRDRAMVKGKIIGLGLVGSFKGFEVINEI